MFYHLFLFIRININLVKKILVIHTNYREIGGEDVAVDNELKLLADHFEVDKLIFSNSSQITKDEIFSFFSQNNEKSNKQLIKKISTFKPDLAYVHNTWFSASLGIFRILDQHNIDTVVKIHNYRYECTKTQKSKDHLNGENICLACGFEKNSFGYFNKYFENSFIKSYFVNRYGKKYIKILLKNKIRLLVLTNFQKNSMVNLGVNENKIKVYPNYLKLSKHSSINNENYIAYAGRISKEKGVEELIQSFLSAKLEKIKLKIIGDGPLLAYLKETYRSNKIDYLGQVDNMSVIKIIQESQAVVTATKLLEGQPTLLCEASSLGIPSIFPRSGGISEFFPESSKLSFEQFNYEDLTSKLKLLRDENLLKIEGENNCKYISNYLDEKKMITTFTQIVNNIDE